MTLEDKLIGMTNIGNTCFIAAALQGVLACPKLVEEISNNSMFQKLYTTNNLAIHDFANNYAKYNKRYRKGMSGDSGEFLIYLFDNIKVQDIVTKHTLKLSYLDERTPGEVLGEDRIINLVTKDNMLDSLADYQHEVSDDIIFDRTFTDSGNTLIFAIKRSKVNNQTIIKDNRKINIPMEFPLVLENQEKHYCLVSFIVHLGNHNGGHYVNYRKKDDKWYILNDSSISEMSTLPPFSDAYITFYSIKPDLDNIDPC